VSVTVVEPVAQPRTITVEVTPGATTASFTIPPGVVLDVESVYAVVDTSGGPSKPVLSVSDQSGVVIAEVAQDETLSGATPGETATWALRLAASGGGGSGSGIQFDTDNQGGWLDVTANNVDGVGAGIRFEDFSGGFTRIENGGGGALVLNRLGISAFLGGVSTRIGGGTSTQVSANGGGSPAAVLVAATANVGVTKTVTLQAGFSTLGVSEVAGVTSIALNSQRLGFYGVAPVARAAHPTTLAQVITLLTNLGLCN
jgi:hypothetical protein